MLEFVSEKKVLALLLLNSLQSNFFFPLLLMTVIYHNREEIQTGVSWAVLSLTGREELG